MRARTTTTALLAAATLSGCGTLRADQLPPPARPAPSPASTMSPAGRLVARADAPVRPVAPSPDGGRTLAVVDRRARTLALVDGADGRVRARAAAGIGPAHVALHAGRAYVTDATGDALLVFDLHPRLELVRRLFLPGAPWAIAVDHVRARLWVTLPARNQLVELPAHGRPHVLRRLATIRHPVTVAVDPASGRVVVTGSDGAVAQVIAP